MIKLRLMRCWYRGGMHRDHSRIRGDRRRVRWDDTNAIEISSEADAFDACNALDVLDVRDDGRDCGAASAADGGVGIAFAGAERAGPGL